MEAFKTKRLKYNVKLISYTTFLYIPPNILTVLLSKMYIKTKVTYLNI